MIDRFTNTNPDPVQAGSMLTICFDNPDLADTTVEIAIDDKEGHDTTLTLTLDGNGHACQEWQVPSGWTAVRLQHSTSLQHTVAVTP